MNMTYITYKLPREEFEQITKDLPSCCILNKTKKEVPSLSISNKSVFKSAQQSWQWVYYMVVWGIMLAWKNTGELDEMATAVRQYQYAKDKSSLLARMKKIEGQARGIQRMIEEDRYCIDIVQQLTALYAAADEISLLILQGHIEGCVTDAIRGQHGEDHIKELRETIRKALKR